MRALESMAGGRLTRGDILRLGENYDLGPGSGPVDLMVYDPDPESGLGLIVVSGYKAGLVFCIFPPESAPSGERSLEISWLLDHWNDWFRHTYRTDDSGEPLVIPLKGTTVLDWTEREIVARAAPHGAPSGRPDDAS